jgi:hypothetical protein
MKANLIDYVDFKSLTEDYNLKYGDLSLEQTIAIEQILIDFLRQNKV